MHGRDGALRGPVAVRAGSERPGTVVAVAVLSTLTMLVAGFWFKVRCFGPTWDANGSTNSGDLFPRWTAGACYTDIQVLWGGRQLIQHAFPYVHGGLVDGVLPAGTVEYPVASGVVIWALALFASTDLQFYIASAVLLTLCGVTTAWLLARWIGWRVLWFSLAPSLVLYSFLNWDLMATVLSVAALGAVHLSTRSPHRTRWLAAAAALLALGGAVKFYPLMFALPVALWLGLRSPADGGPSRASWREAGWFAAGVAGGFALLNLPFVLIDVHGWAAAYQFQWSRPIDASTNSVWYWGLRPYSSSGLGQKLMALASTAATAVGLIAAAFAGAWVRRRRGGAYPWLQVSAAMLCVYLVANKVHSPQYVLWLLPFFVLLRVRAGWVIAYWIADAAMGLGFLLSLGVSSDSITASIWPQAMVVGIWGRAGLLIGLFFAFLGAEAAWRPAPVGSTVPVSGTDRAQGLPPPVSVP